MEAMQKSAAAFYPDSNPQPPYPGGFYPQHGSTASPYGYEHPSTQGYGMGGGGVHPANTPVNTTNPNVIQPGNHPGSAIPSGVLHPVNTGTPPTHLDYAPTGHFNANNPCMGMMGIPGGIGAGGHGGLNGSDKIGGPLDMYPWVRPGQIGPPGPQMKDAVKEELSPPAQGNMKIYIIYID